MIWGRFPVQGSIRPFLDGGFSASMAFPKRSHVPASALARTTSRVIARGVLGAGAAAGSGKGASMASAWVSSKWPNRIYGVEADLDGRCCGASVQRKVARLSRRRLRRSTL